MGDFIERFRHIKEWSGSTQTEIQISSPVVSSASGVKLPGLKPNFLGDKME